MASPAGKVTGDHFINKEILAFESNYKDFEAL